MDYTNVPGISNSDPPLHPGTASTASRWKQDRPGEHSSSESQSPSHSLQGPAVSSHSPT